MKKQLLASSVTIDGMTEMINSYFYSKKYSLTNDLKITHPDKGEISGYFVERKKGRIRWYILSND